MRSLWNNIERCYRVRHWFLRSLQCSLFLQYSAEPLGKWQMRLLVRHFRIPKTIYFDLELFICVKKFEFCLVTQCLRIVLLYKRRGWKCWGSCLLRDGAVNSTVKGQFYIFSIVGGRTVRHCSEVYTVCPPAVVCLGHVSGTSTVIGTVPYILSTLKRKPKFPLKDGSVSRINIPDHNSDSLETIFLVKILKFFDADPESGNLFYPGSGMGKIRIRDPEKISRIRNTGFSFLRARKAFMNIFVPYTVVPFTY